MSDTKAEQSSHFMIYSLEPRLFFVVLRRDVVVGCGW